MDSMSNDTTVTKFMDTANDTTVTKFMDTANDTSVTKFLDWGDTAVTNDNVNMTVIQFLADTLDENDISVTKFLENATVTETR